MRTFLILALSITLLASCSRDDDIQIRLSNISDFEFIDIQVGSSNDTKFYENLSPGQFSEYQVYEMAYRYARVELSINGDRYFIQPIDFIGETPLEGGRYTYELDANLQGQFETLTLRFIED